MKKYLNTGLFVLAFLAVSGFAIVTGTYQNVTRIGPFMMSTFAFDSNAIGQVGNPGTNVYIAGESLFVCRSVYLSARNTVKNDSTIASYNKAMGIVIGGTRTSMQASTDSLGCADLAATVGQRVLVLSIGRTWVVMDTQAGVAPGTLIMTSSKPGMRGRMMAKTTPIDSLYRVMGRIIDSGALGRRVLAHINVK